MLVQDIVNFLKSNYPYEYYPNGFPKKSPAACGTVKLTGGKIDKNIKGIKAPTFQVLIRAKHPADAEAKANVIFEGLNGKEFFNIGDTYVAFCLADQAVPICVGKDDNGNTAYSLNFTCKVKE